MLSKPLTKFRFRWYRIFDQANTSKYTTNILEYILAYLHISIYLCIFKYVSSISTYTRLRCDRTKH